MRSAPTTVLTAAVLVGVVLAATACGSEPSGAVGENVSGCGAATVSNDAELATALDHAAAGTRIVLAPGRYSPIVVRTSGSAQRPAILCGARDAVVAGDDLAHDYAVHLDHATHWRLVGFTVTGAQKGVVVDAGTGIELRSLAVHRIGDEAIHLRTHSSRNLVIDNEISDTGRHEPDFGEGIYVGSAHSNWCTLTDCEPDRSDDNVIRGNTVTDTTAEAIDVKEGTTGGEIIGNRLAIAAEAVADSVVDIKGNRWSVHRNLLDDREVAGVTVRSVLDGWGQDDNVSANRPWRR